MKLIYKIILGASLIGIVVFLGIQSRDVNKDIDKVTQHAEKIVLYQSPTCGCCGGYAEYLRTEGFSVEVQKTSSISAIKESLGVPRELESCHTLDIAGYVVEGHVPVLAIHTLLEQMPNIRGIALAGMPVGSPGMPGSKTEDFIIYEILTDGSQGDIFMKI